MELFRTYFVPSVGRLGVQAILLGNLPVLRRFGGPIAPLKYDGSDQGQCGQREKVLHCSPPRA